VICAIINQDGEQVLKGKNRRKVQNFFDHPHFSPKNGGQTLKSGSFRNYLFSWRVFKINW